MRGRSDAGGAALSRRARGIPEGGDRLPVDPGHPAADAGLRPHRFAGRPRRLDRREVPRLDRLRRRRRDACSSKDQLLANIALYWFTGAIGSSFWPYYARMHGPWPIPDGATVDVPTGYAEFPREILRPPRSLAARTFTDIRRWSVMPQRRPLRRHGAAGSAGGGGPRVLPAAPPPKLIGLTPAGVSAGPAAPQRYGTAGSASAPSMPGRTGGRAAPPRPRPCRRPA